MTDHVTEPSWDETRRFMAEEARRLRDLAADPPRPLQGGLVVTNHDTACDWCRGQGRDEGACALDVSDQGTWVVLGHAGGAYHLDCARQLGWEPSEKAAAALEKYPNGPYA